MITQRGCIFENLLKLFVKNEKKSNKRISQGNKTGQFISSFATCSLCFEAICSLQFRVSFAYINQEEGDQLSRANDATHFDIEKGKN